MISLYGCGFIGTHFKYMYDSDVHVQGRDERVPAHKDILYFISTIHNYHVHDDITRDVDTNLRVLCETLEHCRSKDITFNFVSSWFVYGKGDVLPATESSPCNPTGFYSITKKCAEVGKELYSKIIEKIFEVFFIFGDIVKTWEKKGD